MNKIIVFLSAILISTSAIAQVGIEWENTLGGSNNDHRSFAQPTTDGGCIVGGTSDSPISGDKTENSPFASSDYWVLKLNSAGNIEWQNTINANNSDELKAIHQTSDGGYILGGTSVSDIGGDKTEAGRGDTDYWIVKLSSAGIVEWDKTFGGSAPDEFAEIRQTADNGYILTGYSYSPISGDKTENSQGIVDYWVIKISATGAIQWQNTIGGSSYDRPTDIRQTADGGYIVGGYSYSPVSGDKSEPRRGTGTFADYWIVKLSSTGSIEWQKTLGGDYEDALETVLQTPDGGYMLGGSSSSFISGDKTVDRFGAFDYWIVKIDASGNPQWQKVYGGIHYDELAEMAPTADGGFILGGSSDSQSSGNKTEPSKRLDVGSWGWYDYWAVKIDNAGNIQWQKAVGSRGIERLLSIAQTTDAGYVLGGYCRFADASCDQSESGMGEYDYWIVKLPEVPELAEANATPPSVDRGQTLQIQFSALNFEFGQGTGIYLQHAATGAGIHPSVYSYPNDTSAVGTFTIPLLPCGKYNLITECNVVYNALLVNCQQVGVISDPSEASRCGGELQINFTSLGFEFEPGTPVYLDNGVHQIYPDTFISLNDTSMAGIFTFGPDDSCGIYSFKQHPTDSFSGTFELLCTECATISGSIYDDANTNCVMDTGETPLQNVLVQFTIDSATYYTTTDSNGFYTIYLGYGSYNVEAVTPNSAWAISPCSALSQTATLDSTNENVTVNFPLYGQYICPQLQVDIAPHFLRSCNPQPYKYEVSYCNNGTGTAFDAYVEVTVAPELTAVLASIPWRNPQTGTVYLFDLGDVQSGECGSFNIYFSVSCSTQIGQTLCVLAHIFPDTSCAPPDTSWDGSSIAVKADCVNNDTVEFRITNVGTGNMSDSLFYIIVEDNVMVRRKKFKLLSTESLRLFERAHGHTFRIEAEQSPGHPGNSKPSATVERCGTDSTGGVSSGFVNRMAPDDGDDFIAIACEVVIGSWDPNDKTGYPTGLGDNRVISSTTELEYRIRFQNTGTDTAFRVIIRDTLSKYLDITSFELGAASHPYDFNIYGTGILEWRFENILLPDSNANEPESHGFVRFRVAQMPNNPNGTVIENSADVYFDYNAAVKTNVEFNTVGDILKELSTAVIEYYDAQNNIAVFPNPFTDVVNVEIGGKPIKRAQFEVYDLQGRLCRQSVFENTNRLVIGNLNLKRGMYFYRIIENETMIGSGKMIRME